MLTKTIVAVVLLGACATAQAAVDTCGFERVPREALIELKEARGKAFTGGAVFVNGKYLPPPYTVSRYGTALMVNGHQVTGQIEAWSKFMTVIAVLDVARGDEPEAEAEEAPTPAAAPAAKSAPIEANSVDDLFDDDPEPAAAVPAPVPAATAVAKAKNAAKVEQKYVPSERTNQLLAGINKRRSDLDKSLRLNHFYFFSPRYSTVSGSLNTLGQMAEVLPDALRDSESAADLFQRLRRAGLGFIPQEVCDDLFENKITFPELRNLRMRVREEIEEQRRLSQQSSFR